MSVAIIEPVKVDPAAAGHARLVDQMRRTFESRMMRLFDEPSVVEIMLNPDGSVMVERAGVGIERFDSMNPIRARAILNFMAAYLHTVATVDRPIVEGAMPPEFGRARFEGLLPPLVDEPTFAIRLPARSIFKLEDYVERGIMTDAQIDLIKTAIFDRQNILVSGGTGSGKTTLLNAMLAEISRISGLDQRVILIEDTKELQCDAPNRVPMLTADGQDMTRLLKATMRLRPDRIIVGEVRDGAALALLKAWNTGHPGGLATVHANNANASLLRLDQLCQEAGVPSQAVLIREAVDLVVQIARDPSAPSGRRVTEILTVSV